MTRQGHSMLRVMLCRSKPRTDAAVDSLSWRADALYQGSSSGASSDQRQLALVSRTASNTKPTLNRLCNDLPNARSLFLHLNDELERCRRSQQPDCSGCDLTDSRRSTTASGIWKGTSPLARAGEVSQAKLPRAGLRWRAWRRRIVLVCRRRGRNRISRLIPRSGRAGRL